MIAITNIQYYVINNLCFLNCLHWKCILMRLTFIQRSTLQRLFLIGCLSCLSLASANERVFIVGVESVSYYPLFDFSEHNTSKPSFTREVLSTFFEQHHYQYKFIALPIKRFDKWYIEQEIDFKFPDNKRWRASQNFELNITFSEPVIKLIAGTYVLNSNQSNSRDQIKKLGTVLGFYPTLWLDKIKTNQVKLIEDPLPFSIVKHLVYGNVDAINIDVNVIRHNLTLMGKKNQVVLNKNIKYQEFAYYLSSIKYPEVIQEFNSFLKKNKKFIQQLKIKYGIE